MQVVVCWHEWLEEWLNVWLLVNYICPICLHWPWFLLMLVPNNYSMGEIFKYYWCFQQITVLDLQNVTGNSSLLCRLVGFLFPDFCSVASNPSAITHQWNKNHPFWKYHSLKKNYQTWESLAEQSDCFCMAKTKRPRRKNFFSAYSWTKI